MADDEIHNTTVRTVLGSSRREQRWDLAHEVDISTVLGKSFFDLRRARPMGDDDVEISISCFLGSVELLVPIGTRVTLEGSTFLAGASSDVSGEDDVVPADAEGVDLVAKQLPRLDIAATAMLGRVRVRTPDRPRRARVRRFAGLRRKKAAVAGPSRSLADILAEADDSVVHFDVEPSEPAPTPVVDPSDPVDAEITRSVPAPDLGPVDVTFASSEAEPFDDFDPADFPDDEPLAS